MAPTPALPSISCIKKLSESPNLESIPSNYAFYDHPSESRASDPQDSLPTVDLSLLMSDDPANRSKAIKELGKACQDWGFFVVRKCSLRSEFCKTVLSVSLISTGSESWDTRNIDESYD